MREGLATDPATDAFEISVAAEDTGKVILTGAVDSWQEKELAGIVTKGTIGVTGVDNRITVTMPDASARPADEIKAEVDRRLFWDVLVDDSTVTNGRATLSGQVDSWSEWQSASENAWEGGANWVVNNLDVGMADQG